MKLRLAVVSAGVAGFAGRAGAAGHGPAGAPPAPIVLKAAHLFDGRSGRLSVARPGGGAGRAHHRASAPRPTCRPAAASSTWAMPRCCRASSMPTCTSPTTTTTTGRRVSTRACCASRWSSPCTPRAMPRSTLEAGFTTVRDVGAGDFIDVALRNAINAGIAEGPRMLVAGHSIGSTGGHCDSSPFPPDRVKPSGPLEGVCNGPEECRLAVRQQMKFGADVIKICASGGVLSEVRSGRRAAADARGTARDHGRGPRLGPQGRRAQPRRPAPRSWRSRPASTRSSTAASCTRPRCS